MSAGAADGIMIIELKHLHTLTILRQTQSVVASAKRLHLTQSALSHQIKYLEERLGSALFERKSKPLRFTAVGERLLRLADEVLPRIQATEREIASLQSCNDMRLFMTVECHSCYDWLMPTLNAFRLLWPDIDIDISSSIQFDALPALRNADVDLVITADPQVQAGVQYIPLFEYQAVLVLNAQHPLAQQSRSWIEPADLIDETLICYPVDRDRLDIFTRFLMPAGIEPKAFRYAEMTLMMVQRVASGRGVSCLHHWAVADYADKGYMFTLPLSENGLFCQLYAAVRDNYAQLLYVQDFIRIAQSICQQRLDNIRLLPG